MINSINKFFKLIFFEIKKITRNVPVFLFLLLAPAVLACVMGGLHSSETKDIGDISAGATANPIFNEVVFVCDNYEKIDDEVAKNLNYLLSNNSYKIMWKTNLSEEITNLQLSNIALVIFVDISTNPNQISVIYNPINNNSRAYKNFITNKGYQYSYYSIKEFISSWGITVDDSVFNATKFQSLNSQGDDGLMSANIFTTVLIISFMLVVGISYSMARDNETGVIKQLCYTPMSTTKYLNIRAFMYTILGILQCVVMFFIFSAFGANGSHFWQSLGIFALFASAFSMLMFLISTSNSQIGMVCLSIVLVVGPLLLNLLINIETVNIFIKIILYLSPVTNFMLAYSSGLYYGTVAIRHIVVMIVQIIVYYLLSVIVLKKKTGEKIIKRA